MPYKNDEDFTKRVYNIDVDKPSRRSWPRPETVLGLMKDGQGVREVMRNLGITYYIIKTFRKEDPDFDRDYNTILASDFHEERKKRVLKKNLKLDTPSDPKERFLLHYGETYKLEESRRFSGLDATDIQSWLDPNSDTYDEEFSYAFEEMSLRRRWALDDEMFENRDNRNILTTLVEAEMPEKYKKAAVNVENVLSLGFSNGSERAALKLINNTFGDNTDDSRIIDAEFSEEPQRLLESKKET